MKQKILNNILMNFILMVIFVILNNWGLQKRLEETFVFLALIYGMITVIANAFFVLFCVKPNNKKN